MRTVQSDRDRTRGKNPRISQGPDSRSDHRQPGQGDHGIGIQCRAAPSPRPSREVLPSPSSTGLGATPWMSPPRWQTSMRAALRSTTRLSVLSISPARPASSPCMRFMQLMSSSWIAHRTNPGRPSAHQGSGQLSRPAVPPPSVEERQSFLKLPATGAGVTSLARKSTLPTK